MSLKYSLPNTEQKLQILFLKVNDTNPIKLVVETGKHKSESISYAVRTELRFMQEVN